MEYSIMPLSDEEEELIEKKIIEYADSMAPREPHTEDETLVYAVKDEKDGVIGGCIVNIHEWGRAVLANLWVDGRYRNQGLGSMLIRAAEDASCEKGCYYLCLGTADYMARPLYEKHGFRVFTVNKDIPKGHECWSLCKRLDKNVPDYIPRNNSAASRYKAVPGGKEDAKIISKGLEDFCVGAVPDNHEYITLSKKLVDKDGNTVAAIIAGIGEDDAADIDGVWVEEQYRDQGVGTYLMGETEREAKEKGAYVLLTGCCDWTAGFFFKNGYTVRGELADYPKGHKSYELEKRI